MNDLPRRLSMEAPYAKGVLLCVVATMLMGGMFPIMTDALLHIDPFTFTSLRYLIAGICFVVLLLLREGRNAFRADGESLLLAWLVGSIGFCGFGSFVFLGQQEAGPQGALSASIMMATQPMMGLLVNALVRRTAPAPLSFLFVALSFFGVSLVVTGGDVVAALHAPRHYAANAFILLGALCWVIYTFSVGYFKRWSPLKYTTLTTWLGLTTIIAVNLLLIATHTIEAPSLDAIWAITPHLIYMGPMAGFLTVLLWISGNRVLGPMNGVLFMDIVPITAFVISALTGVVANHAQTAGMVTTAAALILNNLYLRRRARKNTSALAANAS